MAPTQHYRITAFALLACSAMAIALPITSTLGQGATFFIVHSAGALEIVLFTLFMYLAPPGLLMVTVLVVGQFSERFARLFASTVIGILIGLWATSMAGGLPLAATIGISLSATLVSMWAYFTNANFRELLCIAGYLSPLVIINFLGFTPINTLLLPASEIDPGSAGGNDTPVVLLILDELSLASLLTPEKNIDSARLPNFSRLAELSTWYDDTTTASVYTDTAVPAILTGKHVEKGILPIYNQYTVNLFSLLSASHRIQAKEMVTRLCPEAVCANTGKSTTIFSARALFIDTWHIWLHAITPPALAERWLAPISYSWRNFGHTESEDTEGSELEMLEIKLADVAGDQKASFKHFLNNIKSDPGPGLHYLHLSLPHHPWIQLPDGTTYNGIRYLGTKMGLHVWSDKHVLVEQTQLRYALQLEFVDKLVGQLLDALIGSGKFDDTLLIVTSDHGLVFSPGKNRRIPEASTLADVSRVPLFIKYPKQTSGKRDSRKVQTIDILPTIVDTLDIPMSTKLDGQSLSSGNWQSAKRRIMEASGSELDLESSSNMDQAIARVQKVLIPGESAIEAISGKVEEQFQQDAIFEQPNGAERLELHLDRPDLYRNVDTESRYIPAMLSGKLSGGKPGTQVVVKLNGAIAGQGSTYDSSGQVFILLDPRKFTNGVNEITAYSSHKDSPFEIPVTSFNIAEWDVSRDNKGKVSVTGPAGKYHTGDSTLAGNAFFRFGGTGISVLTGWAYDKKFKRKAHTVLLLNGEKIVGAGFRKRKKPAYTKDKGIGPARGLEYWFSMEIEDELRQRYPSLSIVALFDDSRILEIEIDKATPEN